ncbi:MAG: GIY-YIG nuclease family protein [Pseudomonadota bacterium]
MTKDEIISAIRRVAKEIGEAPGLRTFTKHSGIREVDWKGVYWARWGDALSEAGFEPNTIQQAHPVDFLLERYCSVARHLQRMPTKADIRIFARENEGYPSYTSMMNKFGSAATLRAAALDWAKSNDTFSDVVSLLPDDEASTEGTTSPAVGDGWVYLLHSGEHYKIGRGQDLEKRVKQVAIALPEELSLVHAIRTDDPSGIEAYWHRRFADKRAKGEWFKLGVNDVRAFKRRKFQ